MTEKVAGRPVDSCVERTVARIIRRKHQSEQKASQQHGEAERLDYPPFDYC
jgi:hypothetical protein